MAADRALDPFPVPAAASAPLASAAESPLASAAESPVADRAAAPPPPPYPFPEPAAGEAAELGPVAVRLYTRLLEGGPQPTAALAAALGLSEEHTEHAAAELLRHRLLARDPDATPARWRAVSPYTAAAELVGPEENRLRRRLETLERTRARLSSLIPLYEETYRRGADSGAVEVVESRDRVMLLIADTAARCTEEVLTVQPGGGRPPGYLERALPRDLEMLGRGVRLHTLYQHTARYSPGTQEYVRAVSAAGAEVRTLGELFGKMLVFDRATAFLPVWDNPDAAVVLREPSAVAFLCSVFANAWGLAEPFSASYTATTATQLQDTIAGRLAGGAKDELIARRLGMSLRTCRRHIAELMDELGAESRFQAGYLLALRSASTAPPPADPHRATTAP
ncbi:LuxR family transcriptional regulator [Streptomyces yangpuensis]|uniref:LuxR family transcriptional regulator n=1 Tax=Streptomyces yangpuensis TaxID=1648182 RepID=UPI0012FEFD34|nr:LuxR family transcriptional regulator [Streptomyces yangpuensis]